MAIVSLVTEVIVMQMQLTTFESSVRSILDDCTGYTFSKVYDREDDEVYYELIDQYGEVDGDVFYEFDDLLDYVSNNDQVDEALRELAR